MSEHIAKVRDVLHNRAFDEKTADVIAVILDALTAERAQVLKLREACLLRVQAREAGILENHDLWTRADKAIAAALAQTEPGK